MLSGNQFNSRLWRLNVSLRRVVIVGVSLGTTAALCAFAKWLPFTNPMAGLTGGILALLVFGGSFNLWLHVFGFVLYLGAHAKRASHGSR